MGYYTIQEKLLITAETEQALTRFYSDVLPLPEDYEAGKYVIEEGQLVLNPNWEEEKAELEKERIGNLRVTKRVFALALQQYGITYSQLKEHIATNEQAQLEWDLCVELERKNPLLDIMAGQFGINPQLLDNIFKIANGEEVDSGSMV